MAGSNVDRLIKGRLFIYRPDGTKVELTDHLTRARINLGDVVAIGTGSGADSVVRQLEFELINSRPDDDSLYPRDQNSGWNIHNGAYEPLLWPGREVMMEVAAVPLSRLPNEPDWVKVFRGYIGDSIQASSENGRISILCRDQAAIFQDCYIEQVREYGTDAGVSAETIIQQIIDDNLGEDAVQVYCPQPSGFMIRPYEADYQSVWDAIQQIAGQIGWFFGYRWNAAQNDFLPTFMAPPRNKDASQADFEISWDDNLRVQELDISAVDVRNAIKVNYRDHYTKRRKSVMVMDETSIAMLGGGRRGRRAMEIEEADTSLIDSEEEALAFANAALHDLKDLTANTRLIMPLMPTIDVFTGINVVNPRLSSTTDFYAVEAVEHVLEWGRDSFKAYTEVVCSGRVTGGHRRWLDMQTRPGARRPIDTGRISPGAIIGDRIKDKEIVNLHIQDGAVNGAHITDAAIDGRHLLARDPNGLVFLDQHGLKRVGVGRIPSDLLMRSIDMPVRMAYIMSGCELITGRFQVFYANADAILDSEAPDTNFGDNKLAELKSTTRLLLRFNVGSIYPLSTITAASLVLNTKNPAWGSGYFSYVLTEAFDEATVTWNNQPAYDPEFIELTPLHTPAANPSYAKDVVAAWVAKTLPNYGFCIQRWDGSHASSDPIIMPMREYDVVEERPRLWVYIEDDRYISCQPGRFYNQGEYVDFPGGELYISNLADGTYPLYLTKNSVGKWVLSTTAGNSLLCVGSITKLVRSIKLNQEIGDGRVQGAYDASKFWGNQKADSGWIFINAGEEKTWAHNLNSRNLLITGYMRRPSNPNWYAMSLSISGTSEYGIQWMTANENTIKIRAGASGALYFIDASGQQVVETSAEFRLFVFRSGYNV